MPDMTHAPSQRRRIPWDLSPLGICLIAALLLPRSATADIYRYVSREGVECFTDAPMVRSAVRVMREPKKHAPAQRMGHHPPHRPPPPVTAGNAAVPRPDEGEPATVTAHFLPVDGRITSRTGWRIDPFDGVLRIHRGVDIAIPEGTPVRPVAPGVVTFSGTRPGYGNMVIIEHDGGMTTIYAHASRNLVHPGDRVDTGTVIALSGSTGRSTGPHLHFEAWQNGTNVTAEFVPHVAGRATAAMRASDHGPIPIRRTVQADGTMLFTNYPATAP